MRASIVLAALLSPFIYALSPGCRGGQLNSCLEQANQEFTICNSKSHISESRLNACYCITKNQVIECYKAFCPSQLSTNAVREFYQSECQLVLTNSLKSAAKQDISEAGPPSNLQIPPTKKEHIKARDDNLGGQLAVGVANIAGEVMHQASNNGGNGITNGIVGIVGAIAPAIVKGAVNNADNTAQPVIQFSDSTPLAEQCLMNCAVGFLSFFGSKDAGNAAKLICSDYISFTAQNGQVATVFTRCLSDCGQNDAATAVNAICSTGKLTDLLVKGGSLISDLVNALSPRDSAAIATVAAVEAFTFFFFMII